MTSHHRSRFATLLLTTTLATTLTTALVAAPLASVSHPVLPQTSLGEFSTSRMGLAGVSLGMRASQAQRKLGKPQQVKAENSACCGVLLHWKYPEVEVRLEVPEGANQERNATVYAISTRSAKIATLEGIRVGDRRSRVLQVYGISAAREGNRFFYSNDRDASSLIFRFENDQVVEILAASQLN